MIPLCLPYEQKDHAKKLGARWDGTEKVWHIPDGVDPRLFEEWLPRVYVKQYFPDRVPGLPLTVEVVPQTCHFSNVRSLLAEEDWNSIRKIVYGQAGRRCEICGDKGPAHPVEAHEIWDYDDKSHIQRLDGIVALCPPCHQVKHIGFAQVQGKHLDAFNHLLKVNNLTWAQGEEYLEQVLHVYLDRSEHEWVLDCSMLEEHGYSIDTSDRWSGRSEEMREEALDTEQEPDFVVRVFYRAQGVE